MACGNDYLPRRDGRRPRPTLLMMMVIGRKRLMLKDGIARPIDSRRIGHISFRLALKERKVFAGFFAAAAAAEPRLRCRCLRMCAAKEQRFVGARSLWSGLSGGVSANFRLAKIYTFCFRRAFSPAVSAPCAARQHARRPSLKRESSRQTTLFCYVLRLLKSP